MDRRSVLTRALGVAALAASSARAAAPPVGKRRLAVLLFDRPESWAFLPPELRTELSALGWVEDRNLTVQWRYANGDSARLRSLATDIVASAPDAILTRGTPATFALQQATRTIPILTGLGDPIGAGFAKTFARPGSNVTGLSYAIVEASQKRVELLRVMVPKLAFLVIVLHADRAPFALDLMRPVEATARSIGLASRTVLVADLADLQRALRTDRRAGEAGALIFGLGPRFDSKAVADAALALGVPTMFEYRFYVDAGGLASYRLDFENQNQRTAAQIDKVFRGEKAGQIPFELPTRPEFVLNRTTARSLGIALPQSLLLQANTVIE
ncbi:MAG: ABC transporter substrate-binding protein [Caldimonas sp.]